MPAAARYFPPAKGRYEVKAGLHPLGTDFGIGPADGRVFQLDRDWPRYRRERLAARREALDKYVCTADPSGAAQTALSTFFLDRLSREYPGLFSLELHALRCRLSGETLVFDDRLELVEAQPEAGVDGAQPPYASALDALACQVQEDLALTELDADGGDRLSALHLCFPNHWAAEDKIGRGFAAIHEPVPGFGRIGAQQRPLLKALTERGPFVRFAWGLATDTRLNHHPVAPAGYPDLDAWRGRDFDPARPRLFLRIERQVIAGLPGANAFLFTIRTYFEDVQALPSGQVGALRSAIESMDEATLRYKGIEARRKEILESLSR